MKQDIIMKLAEEYIDARDYWKQWEETSMTKTKWSKADHLDYGEARAREMALRRAIDIMGLTTDISEIVYQKDIEAYALKNASRYMKASLTDDA